MLYLDIDGLRPRHGVRWCGRSAVCSEPLGSEAPKGPALCRLTRNGVLRGRRWRWCSLFRKSRERVQSGEQSPRSTVVSTPTRRPRPRVHAPRGRLHGYRGYTPPAASGRAPRTVPLPADARTARRTTVVGSRLDGSPRRRCSHGLRFAR